ncbi:MAG: superoxide dismutase [Luteolibacter sp.]
MPSWVSAQNQPAKPFSVQLPKLEYAYDALAPHIDARTMEIHHSKHHAGYAKNLNVALDAASIELSSLEELLIMLRNIEDPSLQAALRNNGGGHWNHSLFWKLMAPAGKRGKPSSRLAQDIQTAFGSMEEFKLAFAKAAASRFGSGWAWLMVSGGKLSITSTPNQDNPLMVGLVEDLGTPILALDVWEHAYYLNYQNRRKDYISAFWEVVNWGAVSERYEKLIG